MATLQSHNRLLHCYTSHSASLHKSRNPRFLKNPSISRNFGDFSSSSHGFESVCCFCKRKSVIETVSVEEEIDRPPFDINLAVILAGFAFEAYISPSETVAKREVDAANCQTLFLSEYFLREIYDGQLFIKLKKGSNFPALDPWGTSDPYVVLQLDSQVVKSNVKWGTREPMWNEDLTLNIQQPPNKDLQVAAWDANLITPHKRMGNAGVSLEYLCDGNMHELLVDLEGIGGGGQIQLEVKYKSFDDIEEEKKWWSIPIVTEFLRKSGFDSALKNVVGSDTVQARQFVQYVFGQLKSFNLPDDFEKLQTESNETSKNPGVDHDTRRQLENNSELPADGTSNKEDSSLAESEPDSVNIDNGKGLSIVSQVNEASQSDGYFWKNLSDIVNENVVQKLGLPIPENMKWDKFELLDIVNENIVQKLGIPNPDNMKWDKFELLDFIGAQSQKIAETAYIESGLATDLGQDVSDSDATTGHLTMSNIQSSLIDVRRMTQDLLKQTDSILGGLMVLNATVSQISTEAQLAEKVNTREDDSAKVNGNSEYSQSENLSAPMDVPILDEKKAAEMKELFSTAESAMEAWAMLATSLGHPSFVKSEFEKLCFLDNEATDTQVAIWRDSSQKRLVIAFRGTEQARWKDLLTDLMLVPTGLNPERIGGDFKQEVQVHSGFLSAYDSVRTRILSLIKLATGSIDDGAEHLSKWHVYVTGHSLGGALATLLALELLSSKLAKCGAISVTMYNFGSPRVGNKKFAEVYNEKVKDSWRVVNHRDIIPTVPRLMGYCHVAQPIYLATRYLEKSLENLELMEDGYQGDILGESTPDVLVSEFIKGEKELLDKILNTEINIFRSIRDGTAVMQHMEDFYYITLLENVRSNYQTVARSKSTGEGNIQIS